MRSSLRWIGAIAGVLVLWSVMPQGVRAQPPKPDLIFDHITGRDGLSVNAVFNVLQDRKGFIWATTEEGLNKYDGYHFTLYQHDSEDPNSLSHDVVDPICEDRQGVLWVGTQGAGLERFDRDTGHFIHYRYQADDPHSLSHDTVRIIYEDRAGELWVGTEGGLNRLDQERQQFTRYLHDPQDPDSLGHDVVRAIYEDRAGRLWIGTEVGLDLFDRAQGRFTHYRHDPNDPHSLADNSVWVVYQDRTGVLWVGTERGGLDRFDPETGQFTHYRNVPTDPTSLSHNFVHAILEDQQGYLWVGTYGGGLNVLDRETQHFTRYQNDPNNPHSLSADNIRSIYVDRAGIVWIVPTLTGLDRVDPAKQRFSLYQNDPNNPNSLSHNAIWQIHEDRSGAIWLGTLAGGLNCFDRETGLFTRYQHNPDDPTSLSSDFVWGVFEDHTGALWVGADGGGLERLDRATGKFTHYQHDPNDPTSLAYHSVIAIYEDRAGVLWIGTGGSTFEGGGLDRFDRATETFTHYRHDPNNPQSLSSNSIWSIYEDRAGNFWVCTLNGLNQFDRETGLFTRYQHNPDDPTSLSNDNVLSVYEDQAGTFWAATYGGGLNKLDRATGVFTRYDEKNGLPDNSIYGILEDTVGNLWLSTNMGLSRFDPRTEMFRNYDVRDGLQANEFNAFSFLKTRRGEMLFGGPNGFNLFIPELLQDNPYVPPVVINDFQLFNESVKVGPDSPLAHTIEDTQEIVLNYDDRVMTFEFVALNFTLPEKNQYAYRLEGFDTDWVYRDASRRYATYTNLDPGQYTFRVKASNNDGVWNEEGTALHITITPPFWQTWWFYGLCALGVLGVFGGVYSVRTAQLRLQAARLQAEAARSQAEAARSQAEAAKAQAEAESARMEAEGARMRAELDVTYRLQQMLLPSALELQQIEGLDIAGTMLPAEEVGGDYYDVLRLGNHVKIGIGDVTGHGLESGMVMLMVQTAVRTLLNTEEQNPARFLKVLNQTLHDNLQRMQVNKSLSLLLLDYRMGKLELIASGQHEEIIVMRQGGQVEVMDTVNLGFPVGLVPGIEEYVGELPVSLQPGDGIVLYSDGIVEAVNPAAEFYGLERLCAVVSANWAHPAEQIAKAVVESVRAFIGGAPIYDDVTLLVIKKK